MGVKVKERPEGSGIWWLFIDHKGKRKAKKIGKDKRLALEAAKKIEAKLTLGDMGIGQDETKVMTFSDYAKKWITVTIPATCKESSFRDYQGLLKNHILPAFGNVPINEINRLMVKDFLMKKSNAGFAGSTVTHMKNTISGVLNMAVDDEIIVINPAHRLGKVIRAKSMRLEIDPLNKEEITILLNSFKEHYPQHYPMALTLARTGMRLGEVIGLQWGDIDFNGRFINLQRAVSRSKIETPKNGKQRRIDMSQQLTETLIELRNQRRITTVKKGWGQVPEWVFISEDGTHLDGSSWRRRIFNKALEKSGLRQVNVHSLRHGYASLLIQAGESLAYIRDQLGHHSIKVTVDIYGHLAPEGNKAAVDRLDDDATGRNQYATNKQKGLTING
jgi:integrase